MPNMTTAKTVTKQALALLGAPELVYVRAVSARDVMAEREFPSEIRADPNATWYAVHAASGERLAVLDDRAAAFAAARGHELRPVSVH